MNNITFGQNTYCAPSVLSAIAGITTDEAEVVIQSIRGNSKKVKGVWSSELRKSFESLGFKTEVMKTNGSLFMTLFSLKDGVYILTVPGHFIAIEVNGINRFICDNRTKSPLNVANSSRLGQRVVEMFKVWRN